MELKPIIRNYNITVVVEDGLEFIIEHLKKEKAEQLYKILIQKFPKDDVYPEMIECYSHSVTKTTVF